jgi:hypothetical protein
MSWRDVRPRCTGAHRVRSRLNRREEPRETGWKAASLMDAGWVRIRRAAVDRLPVGRARASSDASADRPAHGHPASRPACHDGAGQPFTGRGGHGDGRSCRRRDVRGVHVRAPPWSHPHERRGCSRPACDGHLHPAGLLRLLPRARPYAAGRHDGRRAGAGNPTDPGRPTACPTGPAHVGRPAAGASQAGRDADAGPNRHNAVGSSADAGAASPGDLLRGRPWRPLAGV